MKKNSTPIWGIALVLVGIIVALKAMGLFDVDVFFWISLVIIVPCFIGLCSNHTGKLGYLIGICVGALFMMISLDIIRWSMFAPLCIAGVLILVGVKAITGRNDSGHRFDGFSGGTQGSSDSASYSYTAGSESKESQYTYTGTVDSGSTGTADGKQGTASSTSDAQYGSGSYYGGGFQGSAGTESSYTSYNGAVNSNTGYTGSSNSYTSTGSTYGDAGRTTSNGNAKSYSAVLCGREVNFNNERFEGAIVSAVLGSVELNLRNAIILNDVTVDIKSTLGGVEVHVPRNAKVVVNCTPVLGGLDNQTSAPIGMINCPTIYINATCVLGGVDVNY